MKLDTCNMDEAHEVRTFPNGTLSLAKFEEHTVGRFRLEPGWHWSNDVKPIAGTDSCQVHHVGYCVGGRLHVVLPDGTEGEVGPGFAYDVPPGHDAWVVGDEAFEALEFTGAADYAKKS